MTVFITGAANGIGRAAAERLVEAGEDVIAYDTDADRLDLLPDAVTTYEGDVRDEDRVTEVVEQEPFDVLVNNAGYQTVGAVEDMDVEEVREHYETNLFGMWRVTQEALPMLREKEGRVVNVSSMVGEVAPPFWGAYASSKHAVEGFSDALRREVESFGVDVVVVQPGPIRTGFNEQGQANVEQYLPDSVYSDRYEDILARANAGAPPEQAGNVLARAATADRPRARYTVTATAWLAPKLECILPTWAMDRIMGWRV